MQGYIELIYKPTESYAMASQAKLSISPACTRQADLEELLFFEIPQVKIPKTDFDQIYKLGSAVDADILDHQERTGWLNVFLLMLEGVHDPYSLLLAQYIGKLHDEGKKNTGILDLVRKSRRLTDDETEIVHAHPEIGAQYIVKRAQRLGIENQLHIQDLVYGIKAHHLFADRVGGYPANLHEATLHRGHAPQLRRIQRIIRTTDPWCAMQSCRPYRQDPLEDSKVLAELEKYRGTQFGREEVDTISMHFEGFKNLHKVMYLVQESAAACRIAKLNPTLGIEREVGATETELRKFRKAYYDMEDRVHDVISIAEYQSVIQSTAQAARQFITEYMTTAA